jgi:hypothetical protein
MAIVGQDNLRRVILRERDVPGGANIGLIDQTARFALSRGYHTIVEGIFNADHYGAMFTALISDHPGRAFAYFLDVPFPETVLLLESEASRQAVLVNRCSSEALSWTLAFATDVVRRFRAESPAVSERGIGLRSEQADCRGCE